MGGYEPLLLIGLHGPAVEEGRVSIDRLASLLRDIQLCVRRLGLALASETTAVAPPVSEAVLWRSCTLDVVGFDRGSMRIHLGVPNEIRKAPWPRYHGQPLAVAALDHFLDLLNRLEAGPRMVERIPTNLLTPLKRIARVFDRRSADPFSQTLSRLRTRLTRWRVPSGLPRTPPQASARLDTLDHV